MKAITVLQPWAHLLISGAKIYETRPWRTRHRGPLFIHAGRKLTEAMRELCGQEPLRSLLKARGIHKPSDLPLGALIGTVELVDCLDADAIAPTLSEQERALGDFSPGRWAWQLCERRALAKPIPCRGERGLFEVNTGEDHGHEHGDQEPNQATRQDQGGGPCAA